MKLLNEAAVRLELAEGTSFFCATCDHYWEAKERGLPQCTAPGPCGSPMAADNFSHYVGPISLKQSICFVCGGKPDRLVNVRDRETPLGVCEGHLRVLTGMSPVNFEAPVVPILRDIKTGAEERPKGEEKTLGRLLQRIDAGEFDG